MSSDHTFSAEAPLNHFTDSHEGILSHLRTFGELPALLESANRARQIATETIDFFHAAVFKHHIDEEKDLFPIVIESAVRGEERETVQSLVAQLTAEHREIEALWRKLEPQLKQLLKGHDAQVDGQAVARLVGGYLAHAKFEETQFLPLSAEILGRESADMARLGLSLHTRHVVRAAREGLRGS